MRHGKLGWGLCFGVCFEGMFRVCVSGYASEVLVANLQLSYSARVI